MSRQRKHSARSLRVQLAGVLAVLVIAVQLVPALHLTTTEHRVCVEHGELEHVEEVGHAPHGAAAPDRGVGRADRDRPVADAPRSTDDHEACALASFRRDDTAPELPAVRGFQVPREDEATRPPAADRAFAPIDLLHLAPSHSPPV